MISDGSPIDDERFDERLQPVGGECLIPRGSGVKHLNCGNAVDGIFVTQGRVFVDVHDDKDMDVSVAYRSHNGEMVLHGPHHDAVKYTNTVSWEFTMEDSLSVAQVSHLQ